MSLVVSRRGDVRGTAGGAAAVSLGVWMLTLSIALLGGLRRTPSNAEQRDASE